MPRTCLQMKKSLPFIFFTNKNRKKHIIHSLFPFFFSFLFWSGLYSLSCCHKMTQNPIRWTHRKMINLKTQMERGPTSNWNTAPWSKIWRSSNIHNWSHTMKRVLQLKLPYILATNLGRGPSPFYLCNPYTI